MNVFADLDDHAAVGTAPRFVMLSFYEMTSPREPVGPPGTRDIAARFC
jgi:hypothetical protein